MPDALYLVFYARLQGYVIVCVAGALPGSPTATRCAPESGLFHDEEVVVFLAFLDKDILVVEEHRRGGGEVYVGHLLLVD